jgi:hypothetical protein
MIINDGHRWLSDELQQNAFADSHADNTAQRPLTSNRYSVPSCSFAIPYSKKGPKRKVTVAGLRSSQAFPDRVGMPFRSAKSVSPDATWSIGSFRRG